ncbi:MAG: hypothetical protein ACYCOU_05745 [Sulfobacillus sp.]
MFTKNKLTALLQLGRLSGPAGLSYQQKVLEVWRAALKTTLPLDQLEELTIQERRAPLTADLDNYLVAPDGELPYSHGAQDAFDPKIHAMVWSVGLDVVVFTHQSGNYGRLVSELLDVRPRQVSFRQLFRRVDRRTDPDPTT